MPLILAIEPDRRQGARLTALARGRLDAELLVVESVERAVKALDERVPDLLLTPLMMSGKDEAVLDERLRQLDAAGSHVQTLMIPVLAPSTHRVAKSAQGLLTRLRSKRTATHHDDGCDPEVFASQIAEYLEHAADDRVAREEEVAHRRPALAEREYESAAPSPASTPVAATADHDPFVEMPASVFFEPPDRDQTDRVDDRSPDISPTDASELLEDVGVRLDAAADESLEMIVDAPPVADVVQPLDLTLDLADEPATATRDSIDDVDADAGATTVPAQLFEGARLGDDALRVEDSDRIEDVDLVDLETLEVSEPAANVPFDTLDVVEARATGRPPSSRPPVSAPPVETQTARGHEAAVSFDEFVSLDDLSVVDMPSISLGELAGIVDVPQDLFGSDTTRIVTGHPGDSLDVSGLWESASGVDGQNAKAVSTVMNGLELIEEPGLPTGDFPLESDLWTPLPVSAQRQWPDAEAPSVRETAAHDLAAANLSASTGVPPAPVGSFAAPDPTIDFPALPSSQPRPAAKKPTKAKPFQDEWGFFDPVQCGFAALLAKLDEVTDKDDAPSGNPR